MPFISFGELPGPSARDVKTVVFGNIRSGLLNAGELIMQGANSVLRSANFDEVDDGWKLLGDGRAFFSGVELVWKTWTPTYTNLTAGNGTVIARYVQVGKLVICYFEIIFGSTTSIDGSNPTISLPITASSNYTTPRHNLGPAYFNDDGTIAYHGTIRLQSTTTVSAGVLTATGTYLTHANLSATVPMTWTTTDLLSFTATYEAA